MLDFKRIIAIVELDAPTILEVAKEGTALKKGLLIAALGGIITAGLRILQGTETASELFFAPIGTVVGALLISMAIHGTARLLRGKAKLKEVLRPYLYATFLGWFAGFDALPIFGKAVSLILSAWMLVVAVIITKHVEQIKTFKAMIAVVVPVSILTLIGIAYQVISPFIGS